MQVAGRGLLARPGAVGGRSTSKTSLRSLSLINACSIQIPALLFRSCVTWGKLLNSSVPAFSHL